MSKRQHSTYSDLDEWQKKRVRRRATKALETAHAYLEAHHLEVTPYERRVRQVAEVMTPTVDTAFMMMRLSRCSRYLEKCAELWWQSHGTAGLRQLCAELDCRDLTLNGTQLYENLKSGAERCLWKPVRRWLRTHGKRCHRCFADYTAAQSRAYTWTRFPYVPTELCYTCLCSATRVFRCREEMVPRSFVHSVPHFDCDIDYSNDRTLGNVRVLPNHVAQLRQAAAACADDEQRRLVIARTQQHRQLIEERYALQQTLQRQEEALMRLRQETHQQCAELNTRISDVAKEERDAYDAYSATYDERAFCTDE